MGKSFKDKKKFIKKDEEILEDFKEKSSKKLEPYTSNGEFGKFEQDPNSKSKTTKASKELIKNANRSKKKSVRQEADKSIKNILENLNSEEDLD